MTVVSALDDEQRQIESVRMALLREFGDRLPEATVRERLDETVRRFSGAPIRTFVPVLAARGARLDLRRALATA